MYHMYEKTLCMWMRQVSMWIREYIDMYICVITINRIKVIQQIRLWILLQYKWT